MVKKQAAAISAGAVPKKKGLFSEYYKNRYLFLLFLPVLIYFLVFHYGSMYGIIIAFKDYFPRKGILGSEWVGLTHFKKLFSGMYFGTALRNTLIISLYKIIFGFPAPILLAMLLNEVRSQKFKKTVQTITYLPHFISWVVLAGIVIEFLSPSRGLVNYIIQFFGGEPIFFVGSTEYFRGVIVGSSIWRDIGWQSIVFLAAMSGIDPELYDVADIDGASRIRKIVNITLPSILPVVVIMFIFTSGSIINDDFDQIYNLLNSKVASVGEVISTYTYEEGITKLNYSYATAVGLFKNVISLIVVSLTNWLSRRLTDNSLW